MSCARHCSSLLKNTSEQKTKIPALVEYTYWDGRAEEANTINFSVLEGVCAVEQEKSKSQVREFVRREGSCREKLQ